MSDNWFEISNEKISSQEIEREIENRLIGRKQAGSANSEEDPATLAEILWQEMIDSNQESVFGEDVLLQIQDCDILPRNYVIDWQIPFLGPINAVIRRLINAEIRRFLLPSLEKQSFFNHQILHALKDVVEENKKLRLEIERLRRMNQ